MSMRVPWVRALLLGALFLLVGCGAAPASSGAGPGSGPDAGTTTTATDGELRKETSTRAYPGVTRLVVDSDAGDVDARAGPDGASEVTRVLRWTGDARPEVTEVVEGDTLRIAARCPDQLLGEQCSVDLRVTLPAAAAVEVDVGAGDVRVAGLSGPQRLASSAGDVTATGLRAADVTVQTSAGDVDVELVAPPQTVEATAAAGDVRVALPGGPYRVDAQTSAGDVVVEVAQDPAAAAAVTARTSAGDVTIESR